MKKFLASAAFLSALCGISFAHAEQPAMSAAPAAPAAVATAPARTDVSVTEPFTIGYLSPAFGAVTLGVSRDSQLTNSSLFTETPLAAPDFSSSYRAQMRGGQLGVTAGFTNGGSLYTAAPTAGWNFDASVGYAGFYVHGGLSDATQLRLTSDPSKGWLAGFGFQTGTFNVRLSYMTAQTINTNDLDSRMWMIGGIYQLSPRLRLNADAFTSRDPHLGLSTTVPAPTTAATPQGTGARVGVQLRF